MNQGIGVSAGIGIGRAVVLRGEDLDYSMVVPKGFPGGKTPSA